MRKFLRAAVFVMLCAVIVTVLVRWQSIPERPMQDPRVTVDAVHIPLDLTGTWRTSEGSDPKMRAELKDGVVEVDFVVQDGFVSYWRGTFKNPPAGKNEFVSEALTSEFSLSAAPHKSFLYQDSQLIFEYKIMGMTKTVVMVRG